MPDCLVEELGHSTEIGLRIQADAPEQLFACSAQAMFALLRLTPDRTQPTIHRHVTIDSIDGESLLVEWLSELLYLYETSAVIFTDCIILRWTPIHLEAQITGYPTSSPAVLQIKSVTYYQLKLQANADGWTAQVYFDISHMGTSAPTPPSSP